MKSLSELVGLGMFGFELTKIDGIGEVYSFSNRDIGILVWARDVYILEFRQVKIESNTEQVFRLEFRDSQAVVAFITPIITGFTPAYFTKRPAISVA